MLARGCFETETPNVVDPGEAPVPTRPIRNEIKNKSVASSSVDSTVLPENSTRQNYMATNKGHIPKGIRINYGLEADEEPDACPPFQDQDDTFEIDDGLEERGNNTRRQRPLQEQRRSSSLKEDTKKSIDEARKFAAAMLNESERRASNLRTNLSLPQESSSFRSMFRNSFRTFGSSRRLSVYDEVSLIEEPVTPAMAPHNPKRFRRRMACRFLVVPLLVLAVIGFFVYAVSSAKGSSTSSSSSNASTTNTGDNRLDSTIAFLFDHEISLARALYDESSPQYRAAHWLANQDREQLPVPAYGDSMGGDPIESNVNDERHDRFVQRYVLAVLYFALGGDQWTDQLGFISEVHECSWFKAEVEKNGDPLTETYAHGVKCDSNLRVRNLFLPSNGLIGSIPPEITHLSQLDFLELRDNSITGSLPTELKKLSLLTYLDMRSNSLTGTVPHWLGDSLNRLQVLGLSNNLFHGSLPGTLGTSLAHLKTLALDGNLLTGDVGVVRFLRNLEYLYLNNNEFVGRIDHGMLADMPFLLEADMSHNLLSSSVPSYLFHLTRLQGLDLSHNSLTGCLPHFGSDMDKLNDLKYLNLSENQLTGSIALDFSKLPNLEVLLLHDNLFTGTLLLSPSLDAMPNLGALSNGFLVV